MHFSQSKNARLLNFLEFSVHEPRRPKQFDDDAEGEDDGSDEAADQVKTMPIYTCDLSPLFKLAISVISVTIVGTVLRCQHLTLPT